MKKMGRLSLSLLLFLTTSVLAAEHPLESGYFKWLLHLGQNPADRFTSMYPPDSDSLAFLSGQTRFMPYPGLICDFHDTSYSATANLLLWTPQYEADGVFADEPFEGDFAQIYHIYVFSPEERQARLGFMHIGTLRVWNNNEQVISCREWNINVERAEDFTLHKGVNAMTFVLIGSSMTSDCLSSRIMDRSNNEYSDLTFSLTPPLPPEGIYVSRRLPKSHGESNAINVSLHLKIDPNDKPENLTIIEYIPEGHTVADPCGGNVFGNTIQWSLTDDEVADARIQYSLNKPADITGRVPFCGYLYDGRTLSDIIGDNIVFQTAPESPSDMAGRIGTIEIDPDNYSDGENVGIEHMDNRAYYLVTGLRANQTGGWAQYEFEVEHPGTYDVILDYGEYWTMYHRAADVTVTIDASTILEASLFPTTHNYRGSNTFTLESPSKDPDRKAKWIVGTVHLDAGAHTIRLTFPEMYPPDVELDITTDGRPVIKKIILMNYPGLITPNMADPHHLDSYEHAPARIVDRRDIKQLPDGRREITFYSKFSSLSQGNEVYSVRGNIRPRVGQTEAKFEIVEMNPSVFYLPPNGQQDFVLLVRSTEPVPDEYSELVEIWIQGAPISPSNRLYLFSTATNYHQLPPHEEQIFSEVRYASREVGTKLTDPPEQFLPSPGNLGLDMGRYSRDPIQFFEDQFRAGKLPSIEQLFFEQGWSANQSGWTWEQIWSRMLTTLYWHDNVQQAEDYVKRFAEFFPFYPIERRWDWSRPITLPNVLYDVSTMALLTAHVRAVQEGMVDDTEQFKILHNFVLPILQSYYDALRIRMTLSKEVQAGDSELPIERLPYGSTGSPVDGLPAYWYVKVGEDLYMMRWPNDVNTLGLNEPLRKSYPKGTPVVPWNFYEDLELECRDLMSLIAIGAAARDPAVIDEVMYVLSEILQKEKIFLEDGSFRNEPGSYGGSSKRYPEALLKAQRLFGQAALGVISQEVTDKMYNSLIYACEFPFSNSNVPHLNGGGCMNQLDRSYHVDIRMLQELFPEDQESISLYQRIIEQEQNRVPGDIIDNHNFVIHGWGYAMLRGENGSWDRGMETLLSSKFLMSDPGDHVSHDSLGLVLYGLGTILTPRYGYSWIGYLPPFLNQVMVDDDRENGYYGSFWHFDGRMELPSAVAHTGDGTDCSELPFQRSRWNIQFPEYLFDAYFIDANDGQIHQYDWCFINMGDLDIVEPTGLTWQSDSAFLTGYWPNDRGAGTRTIADKSGGRIVAEWRISASPWVQDGVQTVLRYPPQHSGKLNLIMADDSSSQLIDAQIGYYRKGDGEQTQANSQDILVVRKDAVSHAFVDTLEPIADDEQAYVKDVVVVERGNSNQQLVKVTTAEGEDWVYLSGKWGARPDGNQPVPGIATDADIVAWRVVDNTVTRFYLAGGSYAETPHGSWNFGSFGNHYVADNNGG